MSRYRTLFGWLVWWSWYLLAIAKGGYDHEGTVFKDNLCICSRFSCSGLALNLGQSQVVSPLRRPWNGYAKVGGGDEGGPCARLGCRALTHGWISKIRSRLWHIELRTKLRSKLRPWHTLRLPDRWLHGPTPSWKERQLWSYLLGSSAWISSVSSRYRSGTIWLRHECAGRFVVRSLKTDCNSVKLWMKKTVWTTSTSSTEITKKHKRSWIITLTPFQQYQQDDKSSNQKVKVPVTENQNWLQVHSDWSNRAFWSKAFVQGNPRKVIRSPV